MSEKSVSEELSTAEPIVFSGNSRRAWVTSLIVIFFAVLMFIIDWASKGWVLKLDLNIIEIIIVVLVVARWRARIILKHDAIEIKQLQPIQLPFENITRLSIVHSPIMGFVAAIDWIKEGHRRPKRNSFFASFYKGDEVHIFLEELQKRVPEDTNIELSESYTKKLESMHGAS